LGLDLHLSFEQEAKVQELKSHRKFSQHVKYNLSTVLHELRSAKHPEAAALAFVQAGGVAAVAGVLTPDAAADDSSSSAATSAPASAAAAAVSPMVVVGACQVLRTVTTLCGEGYDDGLDGALTAIVRCISSTALPTAAAPATAHTQQQQAGGLLGAQMLAAQKTEMCLESTLLISHVAGLRCAMVVSTGCAAAVTAVLRAVAPQAAPVMRACQEAVEKVSRSGDGRRALIAEGACTLLVDSLRTPCE
jgi:hypothetical protein